MCGSIGLHWDINVELFIVRSHFPQICGIRNNVNSFSCHLHAGKFCRLLYCGLINVLFFSDFIEIKKKYYLNCKKLEDLTRHSVTQLVWFQAVCKAKVSPPTLKGLNMTFHLTSHYSEEYGHS